MISTECYNCHTPLKSRKPSKSGRSYCQALPCQAAKQRFFRGRWRENQNIVRDSPEAQNYMYRALHEERQLCPVCGLADAVGPYVHRDIREPLKPCNGTGGVGPVMTLWMDIVHPESASKAQQDGVEARRAAAAVERENEKAELQ